MADWLLESTPTMVFNMAELPVISVMLPPPVANLPRF